MYRQPTGLCFDIELLNGTLEVLFLSFNFEAKLYLIDPLVDNTVFTGGQSMTTNTLLIKKNEFHAIEEQ